MWHRIRWSLLSVILSLVLLSAVALYLFADIDEEPLDPDSQGGAPTEIAWGTLHPSTPDMQLSREPVAGSQNRAPVVSPTMGGPTVTSRPTSTPTPTNTPTETPRPTNTSTPTRTPTNTPSPTPSRTLTPTPRPPSLEILAAEVPVRSGPGKQFRVLYKVRKGQFLIVQSKNLGFDKNPWFLLQIKEGHEEWITGDPASVKAYNVESLSSRRGPATYTPVPPTKTPKPVALASSVRDFDGQQGAKGWKYLFEDGRNSGHWRDLQFGDYHGKQCWLTGTWERDVRICQGGEVHPGASTRVALEWRPHVDRNVRIQVHAHKVDTSCGDGVWVGVFRAIDGRGMVEKLGEFRISRSDKAGTTRSYTTHVAPGTLIYVIVDICGNSQCDASKLAVDVY